MRKRFEQQLSALHTEMISMGALVETAIAGAVKALLGSDVALAERIYHGDGIIDDKEHEIESQCMKLLLHQAPVASDLRTISVAMKMSTDLERIGDQASDISKVTLSLIERGYQGQIPQLADMARAAIHMVTQAIDAFVTNDLALARTTIDYDDQIDDLFDEVKEVLTQKIRDEADDCEFCIDLLMIAKYFERIGDHAVNIAEWVCYSITGMPE